MMRSKTEEMSLPRSNAMTWPTLKVINYYYPHQNATAMMQYSPIKVKPSIQFDSPS
jgi:hypothetical protein